MRENRWNGFKCEEFLFEGMRAIIVFPEKAEEERRWLFKTEYFDAFPSLEIEMLKRGWHLAYVANVHRWCIDEDLDRKDRFCKYLCEHFKLSEKCVPVGMSCGGLFGTKFAAKYPNRVSALYLDAPVLNLLSCPAGVGRAKGALMEEFTRATGMTIIDLMSYRENPIDKMHILKEHDIPIVMVYGDSDDVVPYEENGLVLEKYLRANGGVIEVFGKENCGHHPHGLSDPTPIADFISKYGK